MAKILIVDDEPDMRTVLFHTLRAAGHEVAESSDGEEALRKEAGEERRRELRPSADVYAAVDDLRRDLEEPS